MMLAQYCCAVTMLNTAIMNFDYYFDSTFNRLQCWQLWLQLHMAFVDKEKWDLILLCVAASETEYVSCTRMEDSQVANY